MNAFTAWQRLVLTAWEAGDAGALAELAAIRLDVQRRGVMARRDRMRLTEVAK